MRSLMLVLSDTDRDPPTLRVAVGAELSMVVLLL